MLFSFRAYEYALLLNSHRAVCRIFGFSPNTINVMPQDLQHIPVDHTVKIVSVEGEDAAAMRVRELGLTYGTVCKIVRKAPFGGPVEVAVGQTHIGIRLNNVVRILVEPYANATS